jgi:hypothetical protein
MKLLLVGVLAVVSACGSVEKQAQSQCGDGKVAGGEACDEGVMNGTASSCCTAQCTLVASGVTCRASQGACDIAETCDGTNAVCPADMTMPDGSPCGGNGVSACSLADTCLAGACANNDKMAGASCGSDACHLETCTATGMCPVAAGKVVTITDSHTGVSSENMDSQWVGVATAIGYTPSIVPATTLDNLANLSNTDILIVSSGTQMLTQAERNNVAAFIAMGHGAYVQGEYLATYEGNVEFAQIVGANGSTFTWGADITGTFNAVPVGCIGTTPNAAPTPFSQNYGVTGAATGPGVSSLQLDQATNQPVAFAFCRPGGGEVIMKTDQDDIRVPGSSSVLELMKNILYKLTYASTCVQ